MVGAIEIGIGRLRTTLQQLVSALTTKKGDGKIMDKRAENSGIRYPYSRENHSGKRPALIRARLENQMTQRQVAEQVGCSRELYSKIENGIREGELSNIPDKLSILFGIDKDILMETSDVIESFDEFIMRKFTEVK